MKKRDAGLAWGAAQEPVNIKRYQVALAIIGIVISMGIVGQADFEEEQRQAEQYCEMVRLWKETNGQAGWPAYDGEEVCRNTQARLAQSGGDAGEGEQQ